MAEMGATWYHRWALCNDSDAAGCVHHVKAKWTMDEYKNNDLAHVKAAIAECPGGYFLFGDEWVLQGWEMSQQVEELHWFLNLRDEINPDCRVIFGAIEPWHPMVGSSRWWVEAFYDAYLTEYDEPPDVAGIGVDTYYWHSNWESDTAAFVNEVKRVYGSDTELWALELGSLLSHDFAVKAMGRAPRIVKLFDRWAWFITRPDGNGEWDYTALYDLDGAITDLGLMYPGMEPAPTYRAYLPEIVK
jgi:hypothetical protein